MEGSGKQKEMIMIYIYRTLWVLAYVPVFVIESLCLLVGVILWPIIGAYHYIRKGTTANMKYTPDRLPFYIDGKWQRLGQHIEKLNNK